MWTRVNNIDRLFGAMDLLHSRMNRLFGEYDESYSADYGLGFVDGGPRTNLYDAGEHLEIRAAVPGMSKDEINIKIQGNYLELSGTRTPEIPDGYKTHRVERKTSSFTRSFTLPVDIDVEKAAASLNDGILVMTLPKAETAKPKQVAIH